MVFLLATHCHPTRFNLQPRADQEGEHDLVSPARGDGREGHRGQHLRELEQDGEALALNGRGRRFVGRKTLAIKQLNN